MLCPTGQPDFSTTVVDSSTHTHCPTSGTHVGPARLLPAFVQHLETLLVCAQTLRSAGTATPLEVTLNYCGNGTVGKCPSLSSGGKILGPIPFPVRLGSGCPQRYQLNNTCGTGFPLLLSHACCSASWDHILNKLPALLSLSQTLL